MSGEKRTGEKVGWIGGLLGSCLWLIPLTVVFFAKDKLIEGAVALSLFIAAVLALIAARPWRWPETRYWKLFLAALAPVLIAGGLGIWYEATIWNPDGGFPWSLLIGPAVLIAVVLQLGRRTWSGKE